MKTTNKRRPFLEIPKDEIDALSPELQTIFNTLNARLKTMAELHEASAGLRGTVGIASQKTKDERGVYDLGLTLEGNRAGNAADPVDGQDLVTLAYLQRQLTCDNLNKILDSCSQTDDLLDDDGPPSPCAVLEMTHKKSVATGMGVVYAVSALKDWVFLTGI